MSDPRSDKFKHPDGNEILDSLIRIEYEFPPMRAIYSTWLADIPEADEKDIRDYFAREHPHGVIRKIERISKSEVKALTGEDDPR